MEIINTETTKVMHIPAFLSAKLAAKLYEYLQKNAEWEQDDLIIYDRAVKPPRLICSYGDADTQYRYSGVVKRAHPWMICLKTLRDKLQKRVKEITGEDCNFNYVLMNYYRDGNDYIGWHSDSALDIKPDSTIASVSLGTSRDFVLKSTKNKSSDEKKVVKLNSGDLLLMCGRCQSEWKHSVPKRLRVKDGRINLTFRQMIQK